MSNLDSYLDFSLQMAANLPKMWELGSTCVKRKLQDLIFPEGIVYNRKFDACRTTKTNSILTVLNKLSKGYEGNKKAEVNEIGDFGPLVELPGVE